MYAYETPRQQETKCRRCGSRPENGRPYCAACWEIKQILKAEAEEDAQRKPTRGKPGWETYQAGRKGVTGTRYTRAPR